jgi:hypothetical protein
MVLYSYQACNSAKGKYHARTRHGQKWSTSTLESSEWMTHFHGSTARGCREIKYISATILFWVLATMWCSSTHRTVAMYNQSVPKITNQYIAKHQSELRSAPPRRWPPAQVHGAEQGNKLRTCSGIGFVGDAAFLQNPVTIVCLLGAVDIVSRTLN